MSYESQTKTSRALFERSLKVLVEGVSSPSRSTSNYQPYPIFMERGSGSKIYDADGNEYIDFMMAYGALGLGHAHPRIVETAKKALDEGTLFATASEIEVEVAEMMSKIIPGAEKVRFANTGTEAVMLAVRLARGYTGRKKIVKFEGTYHGWYDDLCVSCNPRPPDALGYYNDPIGNIDSSGIPQEAFQNTIIVPWNDPSILKKKVRERKGEIAAILIEPMLCNIGIIPPREGYLEAVRDIAEENDILFIIDELNTIIKLALGGAQEYYKVPCDLATHGKAFGAGYPIAALTGKTEVMDSMKWGGVLHYGTQNAPNLGLHIVKTNLEAFSEAGVYERMYDNARKLTSGMQERINQSGLKGVVQRVGSLFQLFFTDRSEIRDYRDFCEHVNRGLYRKFVHTLFAKGVYTTPSSALHWYVSPVHTEDDIEKTLSAVEGALRNIK